MDTLLAVTFIVTRDSVPPLALESDTEHRTSGSILSWGLIYNRLELGAAWTRIGSGEKNRLVIGLSLTSMSRVSGENRIPICSSTDVDLIETAVLPRETDRLPPSVGHILDISNYIHAHAPLILISEKLVTPMVIYGAII